MSASTSSPSVLDEASRIWWNAVLEVEERRVRGMLEETLEQDPVKHPRSDPLGSGKGVGALDLLGIVQDLGFSPRAERRWPGLWVELKRSIRVEIPDFGAFRALIAEIAEKAEEATSGSAGAMAGDPLRPAYRERGRNPLLVEIIEAGASSGRVLAALARDPVERLLPFVEEIPLAKDGETHWRTPATLAVLRKAPADPQAFAAKLAEVEGLLDEPRTRLRKEARTEIVDTLGRLRRLIGQESAYLPAPLKALEAKMVEWLYEAHPAEALRRRDRLQDLILELSKTRNRFFSRLLDDTELAAFRDLAQRQVRLYLDSSWMHRPGITAFVLANLMTSELAAAGRGATGPAGEPGASVAILEAVCRELSTGRYDTVETLRRLRQVEEGGLLVHSFAFALLRLHKEEKD